MMRSFMLCAPHRTILGVTESWKMDGAARIHAKEDKMAQHSAYIILGAFSAPFCSSGFVVTAGKVTVFRRFHV
jgi:hypothetical protein